MKEDFNDKIANFIIESVEYALYKKVPSNETIQLHYKLLIEYYEKLNKQIFLSDKYRNTMKYVNLDLFHEFEKINFPIDIEIIIDLFELLVDKEIKTENGVVFTPKYISDYISKNTIEEKQKCSIIDPSCGCGIFLISAAEHLHKHTNMSYVEIFNDCIYGIDIDSRRGRFVFY
nr:N-6 DNA methylase [Eubacteriales bacterium]